MCMGVCVCVCVGVCVCVCRCVASMLRAVHEEGLHTRAQAQTYLARLLRFKLHLPAWYSDAQVVTHLFRSAAIPHLSSCPLSS